ncbi:TPA: hypothetical protein N2D99_002388 [Clostridium botulinum]|nr:hypothetical protein [Clostridium botulinum]
MDKNDINNELYCVWCGRILGSKEEFDRHYKAELEEFDTDFKDIDIVDATYNENHY